MVKTKKQIDNYVRKHREDSVGIYKDMWGNQRIYFRDNQTGHFTGNIARNKVSERAVKKYNSFKAKITVRLKGERGKKTLTYNIYGRKQQQELLFRMNKKLRRLGKYKQYQKERELPPTKFREDAAPISKDKKKIDLLFDKYKFEPVIIEKFEGGS